MKNNSLVGITTDKWSDLEAQSLNISFLFTLGLLL